MFTTLRFSFAVFCFPCVLFAAGNEFPTGARSSGLSHASVALRDAWSVFNNPAGIASLRSLSFGTGYENRFLLPELSSKSAYGAIPLKAGNALACSWSQFGYRQFNENRTGLAFARKFGSRFSYGLKSECLILNIAGDSYLRKYFITASAGMIADITDEVAFGVVLYNPFRMKINDYGDERMPSQLRLGMQWSLSPKAFIAFQAEEEIDNKPIFRAGIEYQPSGSFFMRAGIASGAGSASFGFGWTAGKIKCDLALSWHPVLGYTPSCSLTFQGK